MGEVYRARDTKLDRDVAIKVLPPHLTTDPEARARFEREAKAVAALSHPNILAIYDFGQVRDPAQGAVAYAATELLEGTTLRERLADGALPARKVVEISVGIAKGLAAAHDRGIVHRDLKPENVFVTADGRVKILDFGLARPVATDTAGSVADRSNAATIRATDPGTVMGTVGYMSPEQVRGLPADHRSDIFSLGCVLYELSTGDRAFERDTAAETMTAILREDPPEMARAGSPAPAAIEPIVRHCLEKQPDERFQSARDLAFALQAVTGTSTSSGAAALPAPAPAPGRRRPVALVAGTGVLVALAFLLGRMLAPGGSNTSAVPLTFERITDAAGVESEPAISPDGMSVAYASAARGSWDIYVQRIGGRNPIVVANDPAKDEISPAFSPDGETIAFAERDAKGGIFVVGATGESARRLTDFGFHPAFSPDGRHIVFCTEAVGDPAGRTSTSSLWVTDTQGGTPRKIFNGDAVQPAWSPDGRRIAYWAVNNGQRDIYTIPAAGGTAVAVTADAALDWSPAWSPDGRFVYFASDRGGAMNLWRVPIDEATGATRGAPERVTAGIAAAEQATLSRDGTKLVFRSRVGTRNPIAVPFNPAAETIGTPHQIFDRVGIMLPTGISPDGQWLALSNQSERQEDIFVARVDGTGLRRLTDDAFRDRHPVWSPDGSELAFYSNRAGNFAIWAVKPDGSGLRQLTNEPPTNANNLLYPTYSPEGHRLMASHLHRMDTVVFDPHQPWADQKPEELSLTLSGDRWLLPSAWSPNGRWIAGAVVEPSGSVVGVGVYDMQARAARVALESSGVPLVNFCWLADNRRLLFVRSGRLAILDVETGRLRDLALPFNVGDGLVVAPDGKTLYMRVVRDQADLWLATLAKPDSK